MNTHRGRIGKIAASLGLAMSLLLLATCESSLLTEIREAKQAAGETQYYTVTYDGNGATSGDVPIDDSQYQEGETVTAMENTRNLQTSGKNWNGWNTAVDGDGTFIGAGEQFLMGSANMRLYAQWTDNPTYVVSYFANDATNGNPPANQTKTHDVPLTLQTNSGSPALSRTGYSFVGWNTQANGHGTDYLPGAVYETNAALALYAKWEAVSYPVSYSANGGNGNPPANQAKTHDVALTLETNSGIPSLSRTGYSLDGWNTQENGNGTDYALGSSYTTNAALTLFAKWTANEYPVNYFANNATSGNPPDNQTKTHDVTLFLQSNDGTPHLQRTGYTFEGWNTQADGNGTDYALGSSYTTNAALALYARWDANSYQVSYSAYGATSGNPPSNQTKTHGVPLTLQSNTGTPPLERTGYTFAGWNTQSDGNGSNYAAGGTYTTNAHLTLYARWTPRTYTVEFFRSGGSGGSDEVMATYGSPMPPATAPTRTGYIFDGYYTDYDGDGTRYYTASMVSSRDWDRTSDTTLYAKWRAYAIGETGPAGGIVFYRKSSYSNGWRYLEAWTADQVGDYQWKTSNTSTSGTSSSIGSGFANTYTAMSGTQHPAAAIVRSATHGEENDWFLPSPGELIEMHRQRGVIGGFNLNEFYWSSNESFQWGTFGAWAYWFSDGGAYWFGKTDTARVRAVRRF